MRAKLLGFLLLTTIVAGALMSRWSAHRHGGGALAQSSQTGAWVPLLAKQAVRVYDTSGDGKTLISETTGTYFRNRAGSVYQRGLAVLGSQIDNAAHLEDAGTGVLYQIDYKSQKATIMARMGWTTPRQPPAGDEFRQRFASAEWLGKKVVSAVECEGYRLPSGDGGTTEGDIWVAPSLNFLIVENIIIDHRHHARIVKVLEDIRAGIDPDPELFLIPEGFTVEERSPTPSGR